MRVAQEMDVAPCAFLKTNLLDPAAVAKLPISNPRMIVTDCPWECDFLASNHSTDTYELAPQAKLLRLFRDMRKWFTPSKEEPNGHLIVWFTNDKLELALQCLLAAGYTYIGINSWHKATYEGVPYKMSPYRGNVELFLVGEKLFGTSQSLCKTQRGFCAPPYITMHSSKPLEFYTVFLPFFAGDDLYGKPWTRVEKVDLFTRHSQEGFLSVGNEFYGRRSDSVPRALRAKKRSSANGDDKGKKEKKKRNDSGIGAQVIVRGTHNAEWEAIVQGETTTKFLVKWARPLKGTPTVDWVDKEAVSRKRKYQME